MGVVAEFEHAEVDLHLARVRRDRRRRAALAVESIHRRIIERGEYVAVNDEHGFIRAVEQRQAAGRPERSGLAAVGQPSPELLARPAERLDQLGQVAGDDRHVTKPAPSQLAEHDLDDRHRVVVAQGHQRFGEDVGERPEPSPFSSREQDGFHVRAFLANSGVVNE